MSLLIGRIADSLRTQGKLTIRLGESWTIKNGANTVFPATLAEAKTSRRRVRNDIATNRFGAILGETHSV